MAKKLTVIVQRGGHRPGFAHRLLVFRGHLGGKGGLLQRRPVEHASNFIGMVAQQKCFREPGNLKEEDIPAFAELFERAKFTQQRVWMRRIYDDQAAGHVWIVNGKLPGQPSTPVMSNNDGLVLSQSPD